MMQKELKKAIGSSMADADWQKAVRLSGIEEESIVDGPGLRYVLFTQGCPHRCQGCHNPQTHSYDGGFLLTVSAILEQTESNPLLSGITFSGGEPFLQAEALCAIAQAVQAAGKNVMSYSGYTFEQLVHRAHNDIWTARLLELTDILVDGPYVESLRDLELPFRGSSNQRILDRKQRAGLLALLHNS
jgi:anaerobic ribonucleoside-triphosphate reductase activating protein